MRRHQLTYQSAFLPLDLLPFPQELSALCEVLHTKGIYSFLEIFLCPAIEKAQKKQPIFGSLQYITSWAATLQIRGQPSDFGTGDW